MELSVRDWMIIVGVVLIAVVLIDGFRRVRNERRGHIRMSLKKEYMNEDAEENYSSELPSGGARTVGRNDEDDVRLGQAVPMLMESIEEDENDPLFSPRPTIVDGHVVSEPQIETEPDDGIIEYSDEPKLEVDPSQQEVVVVNIRARNAPFKGADLLHILLACDCRFGDMNIFHRYEGTSGKGAIQFSIVNMVEPGVFDLNNIDDFSTPGVSFFMGVPGPKDAMQAFECMVETAQCLVKNLDGELLDESRSVMTAQTLDHCRQKIRDFERRQLAQHA